MDRIDFSQGTKSPLVYAIIVVVILVLIGVLAFGIGGTFVANKGFGVGGCGAIRIGSPLDNFLVQKSNKFRVQKANAEGLSQPVGGFGGPLPVTGRYESVGLWDTGQGQQGIGGDFMTIMGHDEKYDLGIDSMRPLASLK